MSEDKSGSGKTTSMLDMENELLSFEISFLKGSTKEYKNRTEQAEAAQKKLEQKLAEAQRNTISPDEKARLQLAHDDMVLLVSRINKSPVGPILRLRPAFRELVNRYLE